MWHVGYLGVVGSKGSFNFLEVRVIIKEHTVEEGVVNRFECEVGDSCVLHMRESSDLFVVHRFLKVSNASLVEF